MPTGFKRSDWEISSRRKAEPTRATCDKFGSIAGNSQRASAEKFSPLAGEKSDFASDLAKRSRREARWSKNEILEISQTESKNVAKGRGTADKAVPKCEPLISLKSN
jgi:hypothetical protein